MTPAPRKQPICPMNWFVHSVKADFTVWQSSYGVGALSSMIEVEDEHLPLHWEWLVSFSHISRRRLTNEEMKRVIKDWGIEQFEEDNHESGIARKFWLAVDPSYRKPCPCKDEEQVIEGDYVWSRKISS